MREAIRDIDRLRHIDECIEHINDYLKGKSFEYMKENIMCFHAVVYNIMIIGEAANMLTTEFQTTHPDTPWKMVKGMRNYIVHEYFQIDDTIVWDVATKDLNELSEQITRYLAEKE